MKNILIVDDHSIVRHGISQLIMQEPDLTICGEASNLHDAKVKIKETIPEFILLDLSLHEENGIDLIDFIKEHYPHIKILVLSMHDELLYIHSAIQAGAHGYFHKDDDAIYIPKAIRAIENGDAFFSDKISSKLLECSLNKVALDLFEKQFTAREIEILKQLAQGKRRNQIAKDMYIAAKTVSTHIENIKKKLNLPTSEEVTQFAILRYSNHS